MQIDFKKPKKIYANQELHHRLSGQVGCHILAIKQGTLRSNFVECLVCFQAYSSTSTVTPDLNSTVNLSS
jgi:hypothetical protein